MIGIGLAAGVQAMSLGQRNCSLGAGGGVIIPRRGGVGECARSVADETGGGGLGVLQVDGHLLEGVEDAAGVGEFNAVVEDGLEDIGEGVEALLVTRRGWDGEVAASDAPGGARLAEGAARGVMVVAEGLAAEGG